jgi:hypothetical protein
MVVGDRLSTSYYAENKRHFHNLGNRLVKSSIKAVFRSEIKDILTGYRAMSYEFVKTFPVLSEGFEIETEMSIHAIDKNLHIENVLVDYRDRPEGSTSKLNTYSDGCKVLKTIAKLYCVYHPMRFFGIIGLLLGVISIEFFIPVFITYLQTGLVPNFPTLIVCGFTMISAILAFFAGLILKTIRHKDKQDFEIQFISVSDKKQMLLKNDK